MNTPNDAIDPRIVREAIEWMVKLQSGTARSHDLEGCELWRMQDPMHDRAMQQLEGLSGNVKSLPKTLVHAVLDSSAANQKFHSRRSALKSIALLAGAGTLALAGYRYAPWQPMMADYRTGVGVRRTIMLADGTQVILNTDSAFDVHFDRQQRLIRLLKGEMLVTTGHLHGASHPFSVQTAQGNVRALGTRFQVRQLGGDTVVAVYEGAVEIRPDDARQVTSLAAGQELQFSAVKTASITTADPDSTAWSDGVFIAKNIRLEDFAKELNRYRHGYVICDPSVANIMISGVFPLDDPNRAIALLEQTLSITAKTRMGYLTILHRNN